MDALREPSHGGVQRAVDPDLLFQELRSGRLVTLIDVRRTHEFRGPSGHLPGARSIPIHQLPARIAELECHRSESIVVISTHGIRAEQGALELELCGFTEVRILEGGLAHWIERGYPRIVSPTLAPVATAR